MGAGCSHDEDALEGEPPPAARPKFWLRSAHGGCSGGAPAAPAAALTKAMSRPRPRWRRAQSGLNHPLTRAR